MLSRDEALELIERMPYIRTLQAPNDTMLEEMFSQFLFESDPIKWVSVIKTCYIRQKALYQGARPLTKRLDELGTIVTSLLHVTLADALSIPTDKVDSFIAAHLANTM